MTTTAQLRRPNGTDTALFVLYLIGIYLGYSPHISASVPVPCAPSAVAAGLMLLRNRGMISQRHLIALLIVLLLYLVSVFWVPDTMFLGDRAKGYLQLSYSLILGYGAYLTATLYDRDRLARVFLIFCILIVIGCVLETHTGFKAVSDAVRERLFSTDLYDANRRDIALYGGVRPKLFTSEPSYVGFAFTVFTFFWYVLTTARNKTLYCGLLLGAGLAVTRSPTVALGFALIAPYQILLAGRSAFGRMRGADMTIITFVSLSLMAVAAAGFAGKDLFAGRLAQIHRGNDASFFYRITGPVKIAVDTIERHPVTGAGLIGESYIANRIYQIYVTSPDFNPDWHIPAKVALVVTNYFWSHWIYLGLVGGLAVMWALARLLRALSAPSVTFCLLVWAIMGQGAGGYVSPRPWMVLLLSCAVSLMYFRQPYRVPSTRSAPRPAPRPLTPQPARSEAG